MMLQRTSGDTHQQGGHQRLLRLIVVAPRLQRDMHQQKLVLVMPLAHQRLDLLVVSLQLTLPIMTDGMQQQQRQQRRHLLSVLQLPLLPPATTILLPKHSCKQTSCCSHASCEDC